MSVQSYLVYAVVLLMGWVLLGLVVWRLSKSKPKGLAAAVLLGPAYFVLKRQGWKLSRREAGWWVFVLLLMLIAPLISYWLEH